MKLYARMVPSVMAAVLLGGCGARTVLHEPYDASAGDGPVVTPDVPVVTPDVPVVTPDVPVVRPDVPMTCADFQTLCFGRCVDTRSDSINCGGCGRACGDSQCVNGACRTTACVGTQRLCGVRCIDVLNDPFNCGACNTVCPAGSRCVMGTCFGDCGGPGRTLCGRVCVDLSTDLNNCGACGLTCRPGTICTGGACTPQCTAPGQTNCGGVCADLRSDARNCGACGLACRSNETCTGSMCVPVRPITGPLFRVDSLGTNCRSVEHNRVTGDDRGGIAVSSSAVFYTGDTSTGRFDLDMLVGRPIGRVDDGLVSNLATAEVYSLRASGQPVDQSRDPNVITELALLDGDTGAPTGRTVTLSQPITLPRGSGIFAGYGRVAFHDGSRAFNVDLPTGLVTDAGAVTLPLRTQSCESWAFWGVAEFFDGALFLDYVRDIRTIVRTRVPDGMTSTVAMFSNLSDMCSFTVSPARGRWYWHHEGTSQFRSGDEGLGFCNAAMTTPMPTP